MLSFREFPTPKAQFPRRPPLGSSVNRGNVLHRIRCERPLFATLQEALHVRGRSFKNIPYVY
jgi:hypothetical protein